jgi:hypothetical protein
VLRQPADRRLEVPPCRLPLPEEKKKGRSQHEHNLKRGRYNKEEARKKAKNREKQRREDKGEAVSPDTSDMPPFSQFERSEQNSSGGSVGGGRPGVAPGDDPSEGDDNGGNGPPGAGAAQHEEVADPEVVVETSDDASLASEASDPKGKRAWEPTPPSEGEPPVKRARTHDPEPAQGSTTDAPAGGDDSAAPFVCPL